MQIDDVEIEYSVVKIRLPQAVLGGSGIGGVQQLIGSVGGERFCLPPPSQSPALRSSSEVSQNYSPPAEAHRFLSSASQATPPVVEDTYPWESQEYNQTSELPPPLPASDSGNSRFRLTRSFWQVSCIGAIVGVAVTAVMFRSSLVQFSSKFEGLSETAPSVVPVSTDDTGSTEPTEPTEPAEPAEPNTLIELLRQKK